MVSQYKSPISLVKSQIEVEVYGGLSTTNFNFGPLVPVFWCITAIIEYIARIDDTWYALLDIPNSFLFNLLATKDYD